MALARLAFRKLHKGVISVPSSSSLTKEQRWTSEIMNRFFTASSSSALDDDDKTTSGGRQVTTSDQGGKKSKLFSRKQRNRQLWRNNSDFAPALWEFFPSGLGNALMQATENINRVLQNLGPSQLLGKFKEKEECYKLKYEMPGMAKDEVKITVEDGGVLRIRGEHKEEDHDEEGAEDEQQYWSSRYGYYDTSMVLPDDAKVDEIKAEMRDGVLKITIPRSEKQYKDVKEVQVQ